MAQIKLVSLMRTPVVLRLGGRQEDELIIPPSGFEIHIRIDSRTVCMAGDALRAAIVHEFPVTAGGVPQEINRWIRYVVPMVAFESLQDRKDFVTPARPLRDTGGIVRAYRHLRGHDKPDVLRFFQELETPTIGAAQ